MRARDLAACDKGSPADFSYIDAKGRKAGKAQAMAGLRQMLDGATFSKYETRAVSARRAEGGVVYVMDTKLVARMKMGGPKTAREVADQAGQKPGRRHEARRQTHGRDVAPLGLREHREPCSVITGMVIGGGVLGLVLVILAIIFLAKRV